MNALPVLLCGVGVAVCLMGELTDRFRLRVIGKLMASASFLVYAAMMGLDGVVGSRVLAALVLSAIGDALLLPPSRRAFAAGMIAFLLAHVAYSAAFIDLGVSLPSLLITAPLMAAVAATVWRTVGPRAGNLRGALGAYIAVISTMVCLAIGAFSAAPSPTLAAFALAAVIFAISDVFVARQRFLHAEVFNRLVGLPLYYVAQLLFVWAAAAT